MSKQTRNQRRRHIHDQARLRNDRHTQLVTAARLILQADQAGTLDPALISSTAARLAATLLEHTDAHITPHLIHTLIHTTTAAVHDEDTANNDRDPNHK